MVTYIGLEAHDGTGKSTTAAKLLGMFNGVHLQKTEEMAKIRDRLIAQKNHGEISLSVLSEQVDQTYRDERAHIQSLPEVKGLKSDTLVILDRSWASFAAEQLVDCLNQNPPVKFEHQQENGTIRYPKGILKPSITFELFIPEERRLAQVTLRGEELQDRDKRLRDEPKYRHELERARRDLGCFRLSLRKRNEKVSALRAAQVLLGHASTPPLKLKPNWRD